MRTLISFALTFLTSGCYAVEWVDYFRGHIGTREVEITLFDCDTCGMLLGYQHFIGENNMTSLQGRNTRDTFYLYGLERSQDEERNDTLGVYVGTFWRRKSFTGSWIAGNGKDTVRAEFSVDALGSKQGARLTIECDTAYRYFRNQSGDTTSGFIAELTYPKIYGKHADKINRKLFEYIRPNDTVQYPDYGKLADSWFAMYDFSDTDLIYGSMWPRIEDFYGKCWVIWNGSGVICFDFSFYEYTGGAHGNYGGQSYCFDLNSGNQISLEDIFLKGFDSTLTRCVQDVYGETNGWGDTMTFNRDFSINPEGIGFNYDPYEIASYAAGPAFVFVSWEKMNSWIDPKGPMNWVKK